MAGKPDFDTLWRALAPHVRIAALKRRSSDPALGVDDLIQEVRIRVWQVYSRDRKSALGTSYYYKVVNSAIIDALRVHRGTLAHSTQVHENDGGDPLDRIEAVDPAPERVLDHDQQRAALNDALAALPEAQRRALALFLQGFSVPEIAELMNCNRDRAHNLTYRGIRALKQAMESKR